MKDNLMGDGTEQNQRTIDNVKTEQLFVFFLQVRSTPCKMLQQVKAEVQPRLAAPVNSAVVLMERVR